MKFWPHVRAVLILAHIVVVIIYAIPNPGMGLDRQAWKNPAIQREVGMWAERVSMVGPKITSKELEDWAFGVIVKWVRLRQSVLRPLSPYQRYLGNRQPWSMFGAPHRYPARLHIDIFENGKWRPIYVARSAEYNWNARLFDHDRMRAAIYRYAWPAYQGTFRQFGTWVANHAKEDFPEATQVRLHWHRAHSATPEQVRNNNLPQGSFGGALVLPLNK